MKKTVFAFVCGILFTVLVLGMIAAATLKGGSLCKYNEVYSFGDNLTFVECPSRD